MQRSYGKVEIIIIRTCPPKIELFKPGGIFPSVWSSVKFFGTSPASGYRPSLCSEDKIDLFIFFFIFLPLNMNKIMIKQDSYTKANESGGEAQKETMGLIDIGLPQSKN